MDIKFSPDHPISLYTEDKFQRYNFAKRIAFTIKERRDRECIVLGLYGAWGEGKTSVLNFIREELSDKPEEIITINFNPWRYQDENILIMQFFNQLAVSLDKNLKNNKEKIGDILSKYGKLINIPLVGDFSTTFDSLGTILQMNDLEVLKQRIGRIIEDAGKKIVVLIDDIDRLDKIEIHSIFKLVKLTADFSNTVYLLSFDDEMVADAISERFGRGNLQAGYNFLEKIIQVPLRIPMAQPEALKDFCIHLINQILDAQNIDIIGGEASRYAEHFNQAILIKLNNPRLAVRYANSLSFALPLLIGEVNVVDLLLVEAIKIFYPKHYDFIKSNPIYFIEGYDEESMLYNSKEKKSEIIEHFENLADKLSEKEKRSIKELIISLFPLLAKAFNNTSFHYLTTDGWDRNKRIASPNYFPRYFTYSVIKGDISDIALEIVINEINDQDPSKNVEALKKLISEGSASSLIRKLRAMENEIKWYKGTLIILAISEIPDMFPNEEKYGGIFASMGSFSQAAIFISRVIKKNDNREENFSFVCKMLESTPSVDFALELRRWINVDKDHEKIFSVDQFKNLSTLILNKAKKESGDKALFETFPQHTFILYGIWKKSDSEEVKRDMASIIQNDKSSYINILYSFTSTIMASGITESYYSNFGKENYKLVNDILDVVLIKNEIMRDFSSEELSTPTNWDNHLGDYQTKLNLVKQFLHWYNSPDLLENRNEREEFY